MKTSKLHNIPVQAMNAIFDAIMRDTKLLFWMRTADYDSMLYVGRCFEDIWKIPCEVRYENPECYRDFILAEDKISHQRRIQERRTKLNEVEQPSTEFRIINSANEIHWMRDISFPIFDIEGNHVAVAGICDDMTDSINSQTNDINTQSFYLERRNQLQREIDTALTKELKLRRKVPAIEASTIGANKVYLLNNQEVSLSNRQAQCINGLLAGKSSKIIANELELSIQTIDEYITNIRKKVGCHNRISLVNHFTNAQN